jgi:hypothetical protein
MKPDKAIEILNRQIERGDELRTKRRGSPEFKKWHRDTEVAIERIFGVGSRHTNDFTSIRYTLGAFSTATPDSRFQEAYVSGINNALQIIKSMIDEIKEYEEEGDDDLDFKSEKMLENLFQRFHLAARQLRSRYSGRPTIEVEDEYDVQDLLHSFLHLFFEDVRKEEWTPSYAGGSSRVDFLLKQEKIVIEVKKTRKSLSEADIGAQLIVDIARYQSHPDCEALICFVYDPEGRIGNPVGLESDLESGTSSMPVRVIVGPKGF